MSYVDPADVDSPRARWRLLRVLWNGGENGASLALGMWDGDPVIAMRWNGGRTSSGNPQSRGLPTWFVVPDEFNEHILSFAGIPDNLRNAATILFDLHDSDAR